MSTMKAFEAGKLLAADWLGSSSDRPLNYMSLELLREAAESFACGKPFWLLSEAPSTSAKKAVSWYMSGFLATFRAGREQERAA